LFSLAEGVENCCIIICFLTPEYQQSEYCKKELRYACELKKLILPVVLGSNDNTSSKWKPSQWLGFTISDMIYLNFQRINQDNFQENAKVLLDNMRLLLNDGHSNLSNDDNIIEQHEQEEEEENFEIDSSFVLPDDIKQGPEINNEKIVTNENEFKCEGDSSIIIIHQSGQIECNQDLYAKNGLFTNSFVLSDCIFMNKTCETISILKLTCKYQNKDQQWTPCQIHFLPKQSIVTLKANELFNCSLKIEIELKGTPGSSNEHRIRAHSLLPQPLQFQISIEDTQMKHSNLFVQQINRPLHLPTLDIVSRKFNVDQSNIIDFVSCDDCLNSVRYFLLIYFSNEKTENELKFCFGCDLTLFYRPSWNKQFIRTLQKQAKKQNQFELIVHEDILSSFFICKTLFNQQFQLQAIQIQIRTQTSFIQQTIRLPLDLIFAQSISF